MDFLRISVVQRLQKQTILSTVGNKNGLYSVREVLNLILREMAAKGRECLLILG